MYVESNSSAEYEVLSPAGAQPGRMEREGYQYVCVCVNRVLSTYEQFKYKNK